LLEVPRALPKWSDLARLELFCDWRSANEEEKEEERKGKEKKKKKE